MGRRRKEVNLHVYPSHLTNEKNCVNECTERTKRANKIQGSTKMPILIQTLKKSE